MKKFISVTVIAIMMLSALALSACGGGGGGSSSEDLADSEFTLVLKEDGTGQLISDEEGGDFTWELTSDGFKTSGDMKLTFKDDGDNITTKLLGTNLVFEKQ